MCLPPNDPGGLGPKVESWAYAVDAQGLDILTTAGVYEIHKCKLCSDGIVVKGEYGISQFILGAGFNIATLMSRYAPVRIWHRVSLPLIKHMVSDEAARSNQAQGSASRCSRGAPRRSNWAVRFSHVSQSVFHRRLLTLALGRAVTLH